MCDTPCDIKVVSTEEIQDGAIFVVFTFGCSGATEEQTAIYYPGDDTLYTPSDWQGRRPKTVDEIEDYNWMSSALDEAIVFCGLPRAFNEFRDDYRKKFARMVTMAREDKGLSQSELARLSGLKQANISRIESGRYNITIDTIARLSAVLGDLAISFGDSQNINTMTTAANITTLNQLADYINSCDDYPNAVVEAACEANGWEVLDDNQWDIATDGKYKVTFNDHCVAEVWEVS